MSQLVSLESVVKCLLVGRIEGVRVVVVARDIGGAADDDSEVDVDIILSALIRRRVPARELRL